MSWIWNLLGWGGSPCCGLNSSIISCDRGWTPSGISWSGICTKSIASLDAEPKETRSRRGGVAKGILITWGCLKCSILWICRAPYTFTFFWCVRSPSSSNWSLYVYFFVPWLMHWNFYAHLECFPLVGLHSLILNQLQISPWGVLWETSCTILCPSCLLTVEIRDMY